MAAVHVLGDGHSRIAQPVSSSLHPTYIWFCGYGDGYICVGLARSWPGAAEPLDFQYCSSHSAVGAGGADRQSNDRIPGFCCSGCGYVHEHGVSFKDRNGHGGRTEYFYARKGHQRKRRKMARAGENTVRNQVECRDFSSVVVWNRGDVPCNRLYRRTRIAQSNNSESNWLALLA